MKLKRKRRYLIDFPPSQGLTQGRFYNGEPLTNHDSCEAIPKIA